MSYTINEIFYSIQGEGLRAGTANVFVRFSGCNLRCSVADLHSGFDCDTEFVSGRPMTAEEILAEVQRVGGDCRNVIFTGGEPTLQMDAQLSATLKDGGYFLAVETNGTRHIPFGWFDWITVSPKSAEHTIHQQIANEVKYVRHYGQACPKTTIKADHHLISPAFNADGTLDSATLNWCANLVKENPKWRLSVQQHKQWGVR